ncbi:MAG: hypothetical protein KDB03_03775 [Planctomycetales bacterium]|nr:hypothetical protein [Planctomycetales bacterium]
MVLRSKMLQGNSKLEAASVSHSAHIVQGAKGPHVGLIQRALIKLNRQAIDREELRLQFFGNSTATAVLAFKNQRQIVNRSYQSRADNIVGIMTMAAIDQELCIAESTPIATTLVPTSPPPKFVHRPASVVQPSVRLAFSFHSPIPPQIPHFDQGGLVTSMELEVNQTGLFQVVNGGGESVYCRDPDIAKVFSPQSPADYNWEWIVDNPQTLGVRGLKPGRTTIEVTQSNSMGAPTGFVKLDLVVKPRSLASLWNAQITPTLNDPLSYNPWMDPELGECVAISGPILKIDGTVNPVASIVPADYEIGFMQALLQSKMTADYVDGEGRKNWQFEIGESQLPVRDSEKGAKPWMKQSAFKSLAAPDGRNVHAEDRPRNIVPWESQDKKGRLVSATGSDSFVTWLVARHKKENTVTALCFTVWSIDWASAFDFKTRRGRQSGIGGMLGPKGTGDGPLAPLTGDPTANDSITIHWRKP